MANILLIHQDDSFIYNLVDLLQMQQHSVQLYRASSAKQALLAKVQSLPNPILFIMSATALPKKAGCITDILQKLGGEIPIIGIGMGYLAILEAYGGDLIRSPSSLHGQSCEITHASQSMFAGLPNPLKVARYHSWIAETVPSEFTITAHYHSMVMAIQHVQHRICGFQFHPESILTTHGGKLLQQTIQWAKSSL